MAIEMLMDALERSPVIASITDALWETAIQSPAEVIFHLNANILTIGDRIREVHTQNKLIFVHLDLAEGLGRDKSGIEFLAKNGVDGIISTRGQLIRFAKELGLFTVQRLFALDTKGIGTIAEMSDGSHPDMIEIMPGVIGKVIRHFAGGSIPVIAGGLIETKQEVTEALTNGALAVSTGKHDLWYL